MKIIWRDDVRLMRYTDSDGIRYAIPTIPVPAKQRKKRRSRRKPKQKARGLRLTAAERRAVIERKLGGLAERQAARKLARVSVRTKFKANPFPVGTVAARQFTERGK